MSKKVVNSLFETYSGIPEKASFLEEGFRILKEQEKDNSKPTRNGAAKNMLKQKRDHLLLLHQLSTQHTSSYVRLGRQPARFKNISKEERYDASFEFRY